jgi:hypothetical protein
MKSAGGAEWVGQIPADAVNGRALQYYLEARDARNRAVIGSGSAVNPYVVGVSRGGGNVADVDAEDPLHAEHERKKREEEERRKLRPHRFFIFGMLGAGMGYEPPGNQTEVAWQYVPPDNMGGGDHYQRQNVGSGGIAWAPLHVAFELGAFVVKNFSLSLLGRFEVYTAANAETQITGMQNRPTRKATGAVAGFVRARYRFLDGRVHPYVHLDLGGGEIRHTLDISVSQAMTMQPGFHPLVDRYTADTYNNGDRALDAQGHPTGQTTAFGIQRVCPSDTSCSDTITTGYLFIGGGAGLWIDVHRYLAFIVDLNLLGAIAGGQNAMNIDLNLGFGAHF